MATSKDHLFTDESRDDALAERADYTDTEDLRHTHTEDSVGSTTFYADDAPACKQGKFDRLYRYQAGTDAHSDPETAEGEKRNGTQYKVDRRERDDRRIAEAVCMQIGLSERQRERVCSFVAETDLRAYSSHYSGVYGAVLGAIATVVAEDSDDACKHPVVQSRAYQDVARKHAVNVEKVIDYTFEKREKDGQ